jgi:hypothetical protein
VSEVLVTSHVLDERADAAESLALDALAHGAHLTELTGDAGTRLDAEADGVAATLRFPGRMGQVAAGLAGAEA